MATFSVYLPDAENDITIKFFEYVFNLIDFYGIYMLQKQKVSNIDNAQAKVIAIAIGWAIMQTTLVHLFHIIPNASCKGMIGYLLEDEFTWGFILRAVFSNLDFVIDI